MNKRILLNGEPAVFSSSDLPMVIHGAEGSGASLFSIAMTAHIFEQGFNLLFMSGYHMARDEFRAQTSVTDTVLVDDSSKAKDALQRRVVFVPKEQSELFLELTDRIATLEGWVIFLKNIELFDSKVIEAVGNRSNVILAGDIDQVAFDIYSLIENCSTKIYFNKPRKYGDIRMAELPKYRGFLDGVNKSGQVAIG